MSNLPDNDSILEALQKWELTLQGQFLRGSNYTFLAKLSNGEEAMDVVYKPTRGEQPLWDFPAGTLAKREVVAYLVSEAVGWSLVPPTVYRRRGPLGAGSLQQYIEHDPEYHYFNFEADDRQRLRPVMLFDILINNADRKGSHVLVGRNGHIWLIDHGLCFHEEDKLRTVIWDFAGENIPANLLDDLKRLADRLAPGQEFNDQLRAYLSGAELGALRARAAGLVERGCYPPPATNRRAYPWPPV